MTLSRYDTFRPIGQILAAGVVARFRSAERLPLRVSCIGTASYDAGGDALAFDRSISLGQSHTPEDAMVLASQRVSTGDIRAGTDPDLRFLPRLIVIQDRELGLVLAGDIRAGIILWQAPVANDSEARRVVTEASRLRGLAFAAPGRDDRQTARRHRHRASLLEARLVDPAWRDVAAELLSLSLAA